MIVEAGDEIARSGHDAEEHILPPVFGGLAGGLGVDIDDQRIFLGAVEIWRFSQPSVNEHAVAGVKLEKLGGAGAQRFDALRKRRIVRGGAQNAVVGEMDDVGMRWVIKGREIVEGVFTVRSNGVGMGARLTRSDALSGRRAVETDAIEIALRRVIGRSGEVDELFVGSDAVEADNVEVAVGNEQDFPGLAVDTIEMTPAVTFAEDEKFAVMIEP